MYYMKYLLNFIILHTIIGTPQFNLYYTDWINESDNGFQHNCFRIIMKDKYTWDYNEIMSYCMSELPSKFNIENINSFPKFTFNELSKENITIEELYIWSAPIDLIEDYQFYLNQLTTNNLSLSKQYFYNCTLPRFGSMCQYELYYYDYHYSSLYDIIENFYNNYPYDPTNLTCYIHLKCNRGLFPSCLDWTEICNGKIDCLDGPFDEEHCWQLEINQCKDNEYRCTNGQCIPKSFYKDEVHHCIDTSDEPDSHMIFLMPCYPHPQPLFSCEDISCPRELFTSSCVKKRTVLLTQIMYLAKDSLASENCWSAFVCILNFTDLQYSFCDKPCEYNTCIKIIQNSCPYMLFFPNVPVLFNNIYFAYRKTDLQYGMNFSTLSLYICYDKSYYDKAFFNISKIFFHNRTCINSKEFLSPLTLWISEGMILSTNILNDLYKLLKKYHLTFNYNFSICNRSNMYQCINSLKCISIYRLMDTIYDCPYMDDEDIITINTPNRMEHYKNTHFKCETTNKYIHQSFVLNGNCECEYIDIVWCEDEDRAITHLKRNIIFQQICDGFIDLLPIMVTGQNETDETECEQWKCDNIYTHCNGIWNCPNGEDESDCNFPSILNCSSKHHLCVLLKTNQFICLSIEKINDGKIDCLGATDEPTLCGRKTQSKPPRIIHDNPFYCINQNSNKCIHKTNLCNGYNDCEHGDDEQFCTINEISVNNGICEWYNYLMASDGQKFLCDYKVPHRNWEIIPFKLDDGMINLFEKQMKNIKNEIFSKSSIIKISDQYERRCHRGLDLRIWLNDKNNSIRNTCLCPSSYYGDICQYQNQRISLTIKFQASADSWQTLFAIIISLIDDSDERIVHSYEQITFLPMKDCRKHYNMYLIYSIRPKDSTKNYSIHIDFYEKMTLIYRGSLLFPDAFPFLPVHRLSLIVDIPRNNDKIDKCSNNLCIHGKCILYSNTQQNLTFCQCNSGWFGRYCTIQHNCTCVPPSLCIGISSNNRSICVCPINKFGSRCLLTDRICQKNKSLCQNNGQCIATLNYMISNQDFICICPKGFTGDRCEIIDNKIILSFEKDISVPEQIRIHFIEVIYTFQPIEFTQRATTFKTIPIKNTSVIIYWSQPFHIVFIEFFNKTYYLTVVQEIYNQSATIVKMINRSDRCLHINELFNESFIQLHLIRRIKYYHLPCQNSTLNLSCFYDDVQFCLCYNFQQQQQQRLVNCFNFNHNMKFDCRGKSECENDGECFQDKPDCPQKSMCVCPKCYYGRRCQFSTNGFALSLDAILGYHIIPNINIIYQPIIVQISIILTMIFILAGLINGVLALITFKNKTVCEVGCGLYLYGSSITTLFTMIIFGLKFWILILTQMGIITDKLFLSFQCRSIDFLLRISLSIVQWLNACVAIERATTTIKGTRFDKKKSKQAAKLVIIILFIFIIGTFIHDPFYRHLIIEDNNDDNDNEKRIWCIASYSSSLKIWNSIIQIFHVLAPFIINFISSIILITKKSRQQSNVQTHKNYKEILKTQFQQHKHLFIAPVILVILVLPHVIIAFVSKCMKSTNDSWLFLIGYFISFIPPIITFIIFIIPSKFYTREFRKSIAQYRTNIQRRLHLIS